MIPTATTQALRTKECSTTSDSAKKMLARVGREYFNSRHQKHSKEQCFLSYRSPSCLFWWTILMVAAAGAVASSSSESSPESSPSAAAAAAIAAVAAAALEQPRVEDVYSVVSGSAHLPCNITPAAPQDGARLVLWYKDENPQPVYSFDARFSTVKHWSEDPTFGPRTYFRDSSSPAQLIISNVQMEDAGLFKCRVDFRETPTATTRIRLNIVEEPKKPVILDDEGSAVMGSIGPFRLRKPLILVCLVEGGNPKPEVVWWRDGVAFDRDVDPSTYEEVLQNTLVISALDRTFHDNVLECKAVNNNVTEPPSSSVTIVMELPILDLTLSNLPDPVTADVTYDVLCQVFGSQPPPKITWRLGDVVLPVAEPRLSLENNLTTSELHFTPKIKDQGKVLSCDANNGIFDAVNKTVVLNVYYIPVVNIEITNDIDPSNIRESDEVVLKCNIQAHPWVWRILWYRDGEELVPSDRVLIDEQRLKLKDVTKALSGQYVCSASNVEGDGFSKPLLITVKYKPVCVAPTIEYKNHSQGIDLKCQVDSKPKSATFRWLFNSSETRFEIPSAESVMSFSNYKPTSGDQHGQVLCWASNDLGEQLKPCVFHVVPLGSPQPPTNCKISNHTASTIAVTCVPGFSGGLSQHFVMEVFETTENNSQILVASNWTEDSTISVWGLLPESNYIISVKAVNERGESSPVYVGGKTEGYIQSLPRAIEESRLPLLFVIVGILVSLMLIGAIFTAALTIRRRRRNKMRVLVDFDRRGGGSSGSEDTSAGRGVAGEDDDVASELHSGYHSSPRSGGGGGGHHDETSMPLLERPSASPPSSRDHRLSSPERKVSFREISSSSSSAVTSAATAVDCPTCSRCGGRQTLRPERSFLAHHHHHRRDNNGGGGFLNGDLNGGSVRVLNNGLPVERAVVRTFSIDKMRPICPTCNPSGTTPYPSNNPLDEIVHQSSMLTLAAAAAAAKKQTKKT